MGLLPDREGMDEDLPRLDPGAIEDAPASGDAPAVVGVLLAAGTSSRFGEDNKLLADLEGDPLVRHAARTLLGADLAGVVVVVGYESGAVRDALADLGVRFVDNPDYREGLSTSVGRGVDAAEGAGADAVLFLPGDMPGVSPSTVDLLVEAHRAGLASAVAAGHDGRRGNPVLFDREYFGALRDVEGDVGGRPVLLGGDDAAVVETGDPGVVADVDTGDDLRRHR